MGQKKGKQPKSNQIKKDTVVLPKPKLLVYISGSKQIFEPDPNLKKKFKSLS